MKRFYFTALMGCILVGNIVAQSTTGRLVGNISGPDGLLPGATVVITDSQTGREQTTVANQSGAFLFERLPFGVYTVRVSAAGFKTYEAKEVKIDANRDYTLNPTLEIGDVTAVVSVTAGADLVNASNAELSTTVSPKQILDLPINGRNPLSLLNLQAGVNTTAGNHVNGQRTSSTNFTRDGINIQDNFIRTGGFVQDRPNVDDTGEFTVVTQNAGAELGGGGSAQIQLVTPRGGSDFHGAAYIYNRNSYFAANEFGANATGGERPFLNRNQLGGKVGGPMPVPGFGEGTPMFFKDKGFFFVNYERFLLRQQSLKTTNILLPQFRNGNFSYIGLDGAAYSVNLLNGTGLNLANPTNATIFNNAGGVLPLDPTVQARVFDGTPTTGNGLVQNGGLTQQFLFNQANNDTRNAFTSRFDVEVNPSNSVYFVYKYNDNADDRTDIDTTFNTIPVNTQGGPTASYLLSHTGLLGSKFTNEARVGYAMSNPFFNQDPNFPTDFIIGGVPFQTNPQSAFQAQGRNTDQFTVQNNSSYSLGNHTLRFGLDFNAQRIAAVTNFNQVGIYNISSTANPNTPGLTAGAQATPLFPGGISGTDLGRANQLRYLLGGIVGSGTIAAPFVNPELGPVLGATRLRQLNYDTWGLYFNDSWRATPELTLNLGLRWDYFTPLRTPDINYLEPDLNGAEGLDAIKAALLNPNGRYVLLGNNAGKAGHFAKSDLNNFGPVLGVAYAPKDKGGVLGALFGSNGVLRAGFRVGYINDEYVRGPDNASGGNAGLDLTGRAFQNGSTSLNARFSNLPDFTLPAFTPPPISFLTGHINAGNFFNTVFAVDPNLQMQRNMQYNFGFSREIGYNTAIEVRYVGGRSNNMLRGVDFNQMDITSNGFLQDFINARNNCRIQAASQGRTLDQGCTSIANLGLAGQVDLPVFAQLVAGGLPTNATIRSQVQQGTASELALIYVTNGLNGGVEFVPNINAGVVDLLSNFGKYRYDSLQAEVRRRFTNGFAFQANYTFAKTLTDIQGDGQTRFDPILDNAQPELEYARADHDRTHTVNINANYELPFGNGKRFLNQGGIVDKLLGGWQLTTIATWSSGVPVSIRDPRGTLNRTARSGLQTGTSNLTYEQIRSLTGIFIQPNGTIYFIDPSVIGPNGSATNGNVEAIPGASFAGQSFFIAQPGQTGNLGRNILTGPSYFNIDAGLIKNMRFGERINVQFRAEAFNLLNNNNFFIGESSNILNVASTSFGIISPGSTYSPRIMQFAFRFEF
jgi:hypothetical protein